MTDSPGSNVKYQIGMGYPLSYRLEQALKSSTLWKEAEIVRSLDPDHLLLLSYLGKKYLGKIISQDLVSLDECKSIAEEIIRKLIEYQPKLSPQLSEIVLFPYILVG